MIVKVQLPVFPPDSKETLVYNRDKSVEYQGEADDALLELMDGRKKAFFEARVKNGAVHILREAPWQEW